MSCKAKKLAVVNPTAPAQKVVLNPTFNKLDAIRKSQVVFNTFSGKAKTSLSINGSSNDVTLNIRIQRGQKIWVSVTAIAGIEVARALITPDSLLVINKLQGLYLKKPFSYVYAFTSRQINYNSLEALFVGNAIPQLLNENAKIENDSTRTTLSGNLQELVYKLVVGADFRANHTELANYLDEQSLKVDNTTFISAQNRVIPSQIDMTSAVKSKKIQMRLHYTKVDFDMPLEYPFSIPSRYTADK